jgi:integrase
MKRTNPEKWPRLVKAGSVAVKIYRLHHRCAAKGYVYAVAWNVAGTRRMRQFTDQGAAMEEARLKADQLAAGKVEAAGLTREDRDELLHARDIAGKVPVIAALQEWAKASEIAQGNIIAAAESWAARNVSKHERVKVGEAIDRHLAAKDAAGKRTRANHGSTFDALRAAFADLYLDTLSSVQLSSYLERIENPSTRNTHRKSLVGLFRWAQKQNYLPRGMQTEAEQTDRAHVPAPEVGIISSETYGKLLEHFRAKHPEYLGSLVLAGFCGLRRGEIHGQTWEDIALDRGHVRVTNAKRGTPARRLVPLSPAAVEWLLLCPNRQGRLCKNLALDRIRFIAHATKFELPENCFRHAFVSHRVAQTGDVGATALESGNSPSIVFRHYRALVTKVEGEAWFSIQPAQPKGEIIKQEFGGAS